MAEMVKIMAFLGDPDAQESRFGQKMSKLLRSWVAEKGRNHIFAKFLKRQKSGVPGWMSCSENREMVKNVAFPGGCG